MKHLGFIAILFSAGQAYADFTPSPLMLTIKGSTATYLESRFYDIELASTKCLMDPPYVGTAQCTMNVDSVSIEDGGKIEIFGRAAKELYFALPEVQATPEESGANCFTALQQNGESKIGCRIDAQIVKVVPK